MNSGADYLLGQLLSLIFYIMTLIIYNRARKEYAGGKIADAINLIMIFLAILLIADSADYFLQAFLSVGDDIELIIKILLKLLALSVLFFGGLRFFSKRRVTMPAESDFSNTEGIGLAPPTLTGDAPTVPEAAADFGGSSSQAQPTLGRYEIIEQIGKGAMGVVYKGRDPKLQRLTAIKTIRFIDDYDEDKVEKIKAYFYREAEVVARLSHKNIVKIYDVGEDLDLSYLAMEYLEGESLQTYCKEDGHLSVSQSIDIITQVCDALDYAHANGIVHRDIKPGNIMVLNNGEVKVTDFGIARAAGSTKTRTGIIKGTPYYMSPEQARGQELDGRADIFSLGVVFYHVLSGQLPFTGENLAAIMYQTAHSDPIPLSTYNTEVGRPVVDILDRALAKDPQGRYQTAAQMAEELRNLKNELASEDREAVPGDEAIDHGKADADKNTPSVGEKEKDNLDFSDLDHVLTLETNGKMEDHPEGTVVIQQGHNDDLAAPPENATRKIDLSDLSATQNDPLDTPSYQVVKTILPPVDEGGGDIAVSRSDRQADSWLKALLTKRFVIFTMAGILLLGLLGAGYFMLWQSPEAVNREKMLEEQQALVRKIMQEKMLEKQRLASEEDQKQKALQDQKEKDTSQIQGQQRIVQQKLEEARKKQEAERLARIEAEKKKEQDRLKAIRIEKEQEQARLAAEKAEKEAEAERIAEAKRKKIAAQRLHDIQVVENHLHTAAVQRREKRFLEAKKGYETAIASIQNSRFKTDKVLDAYRRDIESILAADDIVYGSKGYVLHKGRWITPDALELARYSEGFVKYKGKFRDHKALKNTIIKLCDPLLQKYIASKYSGKTVHSKNIYFQKIILTRSNAEFSQYSVYYTWKVSTFKGMDEDGCTVDIKYTVSTDKWSLLKGCE